MAHRSGMPCAEDDHFASSSRSRSARSSSSTPLRASISTRSIPLGPTFSLKGRFDAQLGGSGPTAVRPIVVELWLYPDGSRILELSTKCAPAEAFNVAAETRAYLAGRGVVLTGVQQTKTRTALEYYVKQLAKAAEPKAT